MALSGNEIKERAVSFSKEQENEISEDAEAGCMEFLFDLSANTQKICFNQQMEKRIKL